MCFRFRNILKCGETTKHQSFPDANVSCQLAAALSNPSSRPRRLTRFGGVDGRRLDRSPENEKNTVKNGRLRGPVPAARKLMTLDCKGAMQINGLDCGTLLEVAQHSWGSFLDSLGLSMA